MKAVEEKVKTSIYLPASLFWKLKETAVALRMKDTEAMEEAVRRWVENPLEKAIAHEADDASSEDEKIARKFVKWRRKTTNSVTHKGLVELMDLELSLEK